MTVKKIVRQNKKRVGRPTEVGADKAIGIRLPTALLHELDAWSKASEMSRSEAIRELVEMGLERLKRKK